MKSAIIVGVGGQDGTILLEFLKKKNYDILGISKNSAISVGETFDIYNNSTIDILDHDQIEEIIKSTHPDEIYYLAAYHHSSEEATNDDNLLLKKSHNIHVKGYSNFLESIRKYSSTTRIFYASSCLIFGGTDTDIQDENTLPCPNSIYGETKLVGMRLGKQYRDDYNIFASSGILYNHESEYRSPKFISRKIIQGALDIKNGKSDSLVLGDLSAKVDRGSAYDYIQAMRMMLQHNIPKEFIIASGKIHTVQELVEIVFDYLGLDWEKYVVEDKKIIQRKKGLLCGDNSRISKDLGRSSKINFKDMIISMITAVS